MIQHKGIWLPDGETHLTMMLDRGPELHGRGTYQLKKYRAALAMTSGRGTVIDIGAHVGLWSMLFVREFQQVEAFEPCAAHRQCFIQNMEDQKVGNNWFLHAAACGAEEGVVFMKTDPHSSGDSWPDPKNEEGERADLCQIDNLGLNGVDFIKADCEGYELFAMQGAEQTILRCKPTIIVEQKPGRAQKFGLEQTQAVTYLEGLGMTQHAVMSGDYIMVW